MAQILNLLKLVLSLIPSILDIMSKLETLLPESGQGAAKLDVIKTAIQSTYTVADKSMPAFEDLWVTVSKVVSGIVAIFNGAGIFKKG